MVEFFPLSVICTNDKHHDQTCRGERFTGHRVFLKRHGWYRIDPRGDKAGIQTDFCPPVERLAFALARQGEMDVSGRFADALPGVVSALQKWTTADEVARNLPDYVMESRGHASGGGDWGRQRSPQLGKAG